MNDLAQAWVNSLGDEYEYAETRSGIEFIVYSGDSLTVCDICFEVCKLKEMLGIDISVQLECHSDDTVGQFTVVRLSKRNTKKVEQE